MTDNRTTDLLRKLLDERGIKWKDGDAAYEIEWSTPDGRHCSAMYWKPTFTVLISGCTPEQAIAATLGNGTCYVVNETWNDYGGMERDTYDFKLSCGHSFEWLELEPPKHCPDCGKEIRR